MSALFDTTELEGFLACYAAPLQELALQARLRLHEVAGPASEFVFDATSAVCVGLGYTDKWRSGFVNIAVYPRHVTLVFSRGASLDDPAGRLKGEGTQVRHIRLAGIETLHDPYVVGLVEQAAAKAARSDPPLRPVKVVKVYNGPKRR